MKISVEVSMYPLDAGYGNSILEFISRLKQYRQIQIRSNTMSTQIFGEYAEVMEILQKEMREAFETNEAVVMIMKVANIDLRP